jgi:hypothetical protein
LNELDRLPASPKTYLSGAKSRCPNATLMIKPFTTLVDGETGTVSCRINRRQALKKNRSLQRQPAGYKPDRLEQLRRENDD